MLTEEPAGLERRWKRLAVRDSASPKLWMDAYLAAFALAGGHRLATTDAAFKQFSSLDLDLIPGKASRASPRVKRSRARRKE